jgi:parvulin-like peptidyl-prolyl isomerase
MLRTTKSLVLFLLAAALPAWGAAPDQPAATNAAAAPAPTVNPNNLFGKTVVAKGKDVEVTRAMLDDEVIRLKAQFSSRGQNLPPEQSASFDKYVLDQLIQIQLMRAKATPEDKAAGKALAEKRFEETKTRLGSDEAINRQLKLMNTTREEVITKWTDTDTAQAVLKRELKVNVSDDDVKKFFEDNPAKFEEPEMVRASHILLVTTDPKSHNELTANEKAAKHKQLEELLKRARAGEDFAKLAKEYSEDPGSKDKGGEYKFGRGQMVTEFEAAAFSLNTNQVSDIITTSYGYHIIKLLEKIPARKLEYAKVAPDIKEGLTQQALQKQLPDYMTKIRASAGVEILDERLKPKEPAEPSASSLDKPSAK